MKLEVGHIFINDIQFASESKIENGVLYVDEEAVKAIVLEDEKIKGVKFDIAKPGESVRITPVKDVIEPRVKVEGRGGVFPGVIAKVDTVGSGKTYALKGMAVVTAGKIVGFQEGIIDMSGPGAEYTPFSKLNNLVVVCEPVEGIKQHEYEKAVRLAGFRVAVYLGELARELTPDETKTYETYGIMEGKEKFPNLPRVAYVQMLQSQGLLHDTYVYGVDAKRTLSTIMNRQKLWTELSYLVTVYPLAIRTQHMFMKTTRLYMTCSKNTEKQSTSFARFLQTKTYTLLIRCVHLTGQLRCAVC